LANVKAVSSSSRAVLKLDEQIKKLSGRSDLTGKATRSASKTAKTVKTVKTSTSNRKNATGSKLDRSETLKKKSVSVVGKDAKSLNSAKKRPRANDDLGNTKKIGHLEEEIRKLYDVVEDDDFLEKTIKMKSSATVISNRGDGTILDNVSMSFLNNMLLVFFAVFMVLFVAFIAFVVFVSTF